MAIPDIKNKQLAVAIANEGNDRKSFFDKLLMSDFGKSNIENGRNNIDKLLSKNNVDLDQKRTIRRIASNTDEMVLLLRNMSDNGKKNGGLNLSSLLGGLIPLAAGLLAPGATKPITTALKTARALPMAAKLAGAAGTAGTVAKGIGAAGKAGKALGVLGKFGDSKLVNSAVRWGGVGMIGANLFEGDYVGAGMEGASLAAHEASRKAKSPKIKAALTAASLATDGAILARDYLGAGGMAAALGGTAIGGLAAAKLLGGAKAAAPAASLVGGSTLAKAGGKLIPGVGLAMGAAGAVGRAGKGDYIGAAGEAVSGLASLIPGIGTMASIAISAGLSYRDSQKANADQLKTSLVTMEKATNSNKDSINESSKIVKSSIGAMSKNEKGVRLAVGALSLALGGFTTIFGDNILGWLRDSRSLFADAFIKLTQFSGSITGWLKDKLSFGGSDTGGSTADYKASADARRLRTALGKGDISKAEFGAVSAAFESGGKGVGTVSSGIGDHGGVSYGKHQMTAGTMKSFLNSKAGSPYKSQFAGLQPGTSAFNDKYKQIAATDSRFGAAQKTFIDSEYYGRSAIDIKNKTGLDLSKRGRALRELVYSTAVQYGPTKMGDWLKRIYGNKASSVSDAAIITAIQNYKLTNNDSLMKSSSKSVRKGVADRIVTEKEMLLNINRTNGGTAGNDNLTAANKVSNPSAQNTKPTAGSAQSKINAMASNITSGAGMNRTQPGAGVLLPGATLAKGSSTTEKPATPSNKKAAASWDLDKLVDTAVANAKASPTYGKCALGVRKALQAASLKAKIGSLGNANEYSKSLASIGWVNVGNNLTSWKKGDISVFQATGSTEGKKYGHVAIWSGAVWVSDHIQKSIQPNVALGNYPYSIWRAKSGISNGQAVTAAASATPDGELTKAGDTTGGSESSSNPFDVAANAVTGGLAALATAFGNSESVKSALDWVNSAKVDAPFKRVSDTASLAGFDMSVPTQGEYTYKGGNGGGYNESELFGGPLIRQQKGQDILGQAGSMGGIIRQNQGYDVLGQAGNLGGIVRQRGGSSKSNWFDKIFGNGAGDDIFRSLANAFGLGSVYDLGKSINNGDDLDTVLGKAVPVLQANIEEKSKMDGYISKLNNEYHNPTTPPLDSSQNNVGPESMPNTSLAGGRKSGNIDGMSSDIVTRNPDSIFREVSISMMRASTT